ncbi:MAG: hypothetical protein DHS20C21_07930 [Gemmatimonadota bacterium]|nr:MAG: hypothetical protein DHS20C21_07930 [Gemmatimonadota bacterium]
MKRTLLAMTALLILPATALATPEVNVDVRISAARGSGSGFCDSSCGYRSCGGTHHSNEAWVDFHPDRGAFVALYAAFSDGSVSLVFPTEDWNSHWVDPRDDYSVPVWVPNGLRLESVQAVASREWFDPSECYVTYAPNAGYHHGRDGLQVTVVTSHRRPLVAWNFSVVWGSSHRYEIARSWCWEPRHVSHVTWAPHRSHQWSARHKSKWKAHPSRRYADSHTWSRDHGDRDRDHYRADRDRGKSSSKSKSRTPARVQETQRKKVTSTKKTTSVKVARTGRDQAVPGTARWTSGERSSQDKKKVKTASGAKSSKSRKDSGEPKRRSGS